MPTSPTEVKYGQELALENAPVLSAEELHTLKMRMAVMDKLLAEKRRAKFKIEIMLGSQYRSGQHYPGALSLWLSGTKLHGGGDEKCFLCPGCGALILPSGQGYGHGVCGKCGKTWKGSQLIGEIMLRLTTQHWVDVLYKWFRFLDFNADLYMKRPKLDLRVAASLEQARQLGGEKLMATRKKMETVVYPLAHILKDTAAGASIPSRIRAFLEA
jgi:hypothetical protein